MLKRIALVLIVILSCFFTVCAENGADSAEQDTLSWSVIGSPSSLDSIWAVQYDAAGRMSCIRQILPGGSANSSGVIDFNSISGASYKFFTVGKNLAPQAKAQGSSEKIDGSYCVDIMTASGPIEQLCDRFRYGMASGTLPAFASPRNNYANSSTLSHLVYDGDGTIYLSTVKYNVSDFAKLTDHLTRTLKLAKEYNTTEDAEYKAELGDAIVGLLAYWAKQDYQSSNWWYNEINTPNLIGEIALLIEDRLTPELLNSILPIMADGCFTVHSDLLDETGANGVWLAYSTLKYGMLTKDSATVVSAINKIKSEMKFSDGEGIRSDGSFMQHGRRLYNGGYGVALIENTASILYLLNNTAYEFAEDDVAALNTMILDGLTYFSIGNTVDPQTVGRDVSRPGGTSIESLADNLRLLAKLNPFTERAQISEYAKSIEKDARQDLGLKYFDLAKYIVINNSDFYFSFRGCDSNLYYGENLNDENILSYNTSYGTTTTIAGKSANFEALYPIMDYSLIPGTTAVYESDSELLEHTDYNKRTLSGTFGGQSFSGQATGGQATSDCAVSFAKSSHEGTSFTVACFACGSSAVILGAGLSSTSGKEMYTCLQQEIADGEFSRSGDTVCFNGVKYTKYSGGEMTAEIKEQSGSWRRNRVSGSTDTVSGKVFTLKLANSGSYAYSVMSENTNDVYQVVVNSEKVQAVVMPDGTLCAVFYGITSFKYGGKTYIGTKGKVLVEAVDN